MCCHVLVYILHIIVSLNFHNKPDRRCYHNYSYRDCHFTVEETEATSNMPKVTQLLSPNTEIRTQAVWLRVLALTPLFPISESLPSCTICPAWPELRAQHKFHKFLFQLDPTTGRVTRMSRTSVFLYEKGNIPCLQDWDKKVRKCM